jgi:hypothetical protein
MQNFEGEMNIYAQGLEELADTPRCNIKGGLYDSN